MQKFIDIVNVDVGYDARNIILKKISLIVKKQDFVVIQGKNGSGKSTLLKLIYMQLLPLSGTYFLFNQSITRRCKQQILDFRKNMGVILQNNYLIPYLTVFQNIDLALQIQEEKDLNFSTRIDEIIDWVGLKGFNNEKVSILSEGQKQKVGIARALVSRPKILVADEPINNLDTETKDKLLFLLKSINRLGTTIIMTDKEQTNYDDLGSNFFSLRNKTIIAK